MLHHDLQHLCNNLHGQAHSEAVRRVTVYFTFHRRRSQKGHMVMSVTVVLRGSSCFFIQTACEPQVTLTTPPLCAQIQTAAAEFVIPLKLTNSWLSPRLPMLKQMHTICTDSADLI
jgi:hypothetical protein